MSSRKPRPPGTGGNSPFGASAKPGFPPGRPRPAGFARPSPNFRGDAQLWLYGQHAVIAALANPARQLRRLIATAEAAARLIEPPLAPEILDRAEIDRFLPAGAVHQGLALLAEPLPVRHLDDMLEAVEPTSLFLVLDQVTDPHNVGAILRSAAAFEATAVILPERHSPPLTGALAKVASGAIERVPVVRVVNLARALEGLAEVDVWRVGLDEAGTLPLAGALRVGPTALVLGAEGNGMRRLTLRGCDALARLPTAAEFSALNVSNAAAIALYAARATTPLA